MTSSLLRVVVDDFDVPHLLYLLALPLRAGTSLSSQESCTSRLFLGHREHTGSQQRKLGTTIHTPLNELESVHMPFKRALAAIGSESPASTAALSRFGSLWQTTSTRASGSVRQK